MIDKSKEKYITQGDVAITDIVVGKPGEDVDIYDTFGTYKGTVPAPRVKLAQPDGTPIEITSVDGPGVVIVPESAIKLKPARPRFQPPPAKRR